MKEQAEKYAKSITKNETYQKYLIEAFIEGWKQCKASEITYVTSNTNEQESTFKHFQD